MHPYLAGFDAAGPTEGVLFVGPIHEKFNLFRTAPCERIIISLDCADDRDG